MQKQKCRSTALYRSLGGINGYGAARLGRQRRKLTVCGGSVGGNGLTKIRVSCHHLQRATRLILTAVDAVQRQSPKISSQQLNRSVSLQS